MGMDFSEMKEITRHLRNGHEKEGFTIRFAALLCLIRGRHPILEDSRVTMQMPENLLL